MRSKNTLILFAKAPRLCRVKTRLWPELTHRECLYLYKLLLSNTLKSVANSQQYKLVVYTTDLNFFATSIPISKLSFKKQHGKNLGIRMHNAISQELKYCQKVILIGSDCIEFSRQYIEHAFKLLKNKDDIVITPTDDGGYCLIGMTQNNNSIFQNIDWGTDRVFSQTQHLTKKKLKNLHALSKMYDIDKVSDINTLNHLGILPNNLQMFDRQ